MNDTEKKIWSYLINYGMTPAGAAGMMGNIYAESGCLPYKVEDLCLWRLKEQGKIYTDATYTAFVDDGTISREEFLHPLPGKQYGYGLCQWTSPARKGALYDLCKQCGASIGSLTEQLRHLVLELMNNYPAVWKVLSTTSDILTASNAVLLKFEQPSATGESVRRLRYEYSVAYYEAMGVDEMNEAEAINRVLDIALAEVGYHETGNNITKYGKEMHSLQPSNMDYPAAWCDAFVDWCFYKAFGAEAARKALCGTFDDYTVNSANMYKQAGRWTNIAAKGYQIFFRNSSGICHTGLVWKVSGGMVYTVEGNKSDAVRKCEYIASDTKIAGYGMPRYNVVADVYYVQSSWADKGSRVGVYSDLDKAKAAARKNKSLYVFDQNGKIIYPVHKTVKAIIERAVQWANAIANGKSHGYCNTESGRWGQNGDYACSTFIITDWDQAGVPVKANGATVTSDMRQAFIRAGFKDVTDSVNFNNCAGMVRGDVLLAPGQHTELYIGSKRLIGARGNAYSNTPENGKPGDQTGQEIVKSAYFNNPWVFCLRYVGLPKTKRVQCGSFQKKANAVDLQTKIKQKTGITTVITKIDNWYTVRTKAMTENEAKDTVSKLKKAGFTDVVVI